MRIRKQISKFLIGAFALTALMVPVVAHADIDLGVDLIPDEYEDKLCEDLEGSTGGVLGCEGSDEDITSFTEFEGSFEAPSSEGYDEGLTRATSAREFILNVTNFALSFLGLVAIVVIIYGGFLYVTAGGEDEQTTKGKKSVMYAIIGIIIVLSSYAIVNTIIGEAAGGGEDRGGGSIYASGDEVTGDEVDVYNVNQIADTIQDITAEYVDTYTTYANAYAYVDYAREYDIPEVDAVNSFFDWSDDSDDPVLEEDVKLLREYVEIMDDVAQEVMDMVDRYSDTYEAASNMKSYTESVLYDARWDITYSKNWLIPTAYADNDSYYEYGDFEDLGENVYGYLSSIESAIYRDFNGSMDEYIEELTSIGRLFGVTGGVVDLTDQFPEIEALFEDALDALEEGKATTGSESITIPVTGDTLTYTYITFPSNSSLRDIVEVLGSLYSSVSNLEFVSAQITASVKEGSAPLVVSFDGLSSYDPSDLTIQDDQYYWDLDGDGNYDESGASVSYTYDEVGTYRVGLRVTSQDENTAPGQSYISITVNPPDSNIVVTATTKGGDTVPLADYANGINRSSAKFTETEGKTGIVVSLEGTTDGNGDDTVYHYLSCGNGDEFESENIIEEICTYSTAGKYTLKVEVTDITGTKDRYIGTIYVASPASRITPLSYTGDLDTQFGFDGSASTTDVGSIVDYLWTAVVDGKEVDLGNSEDIDYKFEKPGEYEVSLTVIDSSGNEDTDTVEIKVESQEPVAKFEYTMPDTTQPGTVHLDAGDSYDPDPGDTLTYLWTIDADDYEFVEGSDTSEEPVVKFGEAGTYEVTLEVTDQHLGDMQKTNASVMDVEVTSVLDINLELPDGLAYQLDDDGEVEVDLKAESDNAIAFEIEFGDGEEDASEGVSGSKTFTHIYTEAGTYYVSLTAYDEDDNENYYTKKLYVGDSESTIAVIYVEKDDAAVASLDVTGNTTTVFTFDASESKNTNGTSRNLKYSWDFGDGTLSTEKSVNHTYEDTGIYTVELTVSDEDDPSIKSEDSFEVTIAEEPPEINNLSYSIKSDTTVTPVEVRLEVDAEDPDGSIANYYWYYYDTSNTTDKLGAQITETPSATLTVSTRGTTGEEKEYAFVVEVTDKAGNTVSSKDELDEDPTIEVENGENAAPVAEYTVSDTNIMLGDSVTLSSSSYDPDDDAITYIWDTEGDGFSNNDETDEATYIYTPELAGCYKIGLKVIDSKDQSSTASKEYTVCVESLTADPEAAFVYDVMGFEVQFTNNSDIDTESGAELYATYWDFDTSVDSDGNGDPADDEDSKEENPSYTYDAEGEYRVKLTIYDNAGAMDEVTNSVLVTDTDPPTAAFTYEANELTVSFENNSEASEDFIVLTSYEWDFDTAEDSDGDGDAGNDTDSVSDVPSYTYDDYGTYTVSLTVMDSANKEDSVTQIITLEEPVIELEGYLQTYPEASPSDGKIHMSGDSGNIDFYYSTNLDSGEGITCWIDKNIYFDTDGNGVKNDDHDLEDTSCTSGTFSSVYYESSWGLIVMMLTVEDTAHENSYEVMKEIVFDLEDGATNIFPVSSKEGLILIMVAVSFALLGASIYTVKKIN